MILFIADLTAVSPLMVGGGYEENSDKDVLLDANDAPYIPGTTLAGVCRHYFHYFSDDSWVENIFGKQLTTKKEKGCNSKIIFYDAEHDGDFFISIRDGVKLEKTRIATDKAKYDYEIVEAGAKFTLQIEYSNEDDECEQDIIDKIVCGINCGDIRVGSKTTRGFGRLNVDVKTATLKHIDLKSDIQSYIDFKWSDFNRKDAKYRYKPGKIINNSKYETLILDFDISSFLLIRNNSSSEKTEEGKFVDAAQLTDNNDIPIIPGTTWAGVFRHHFARILEEINYSERRSLERYLFGFVDEKSKSESKTTIDKQRSKITFSSSIIENAEMRNRTRTAVDRFTGGSGDELLFTTCPSFCGNGELSITLPIDINDKDKVLIKSIISVCVDDINEGFVNIGSESSVGGGFLKMQKRGDWKCQ